MSACKNCFNAEATPGYSSCPRCRRIRREAARRRRGPRLAKSPCVQCGNALDRKGYKCSRCIADAALRSLRRVPYDEIRQWLDDRRAV